MRMQPRLLLSALNAMYLLLVCGTPASAQDRVFSLKKAGTLPKPTQMHGSAIVGARIYIFGGHGNSGWNNDCFSADIRADGTVAQWRTEVQLPQRRAYLNNCVEVINDRIYLVSAHVAATADAPENAIANVPTVLWTTVDKDGRITAWKESSRWSNEIYTMGATCSTENHLYIIGGVNGEMVARRNVIAAEFAPDGEPRNWRQAGELPIPLWFEAAAVIDDRIYVWGGLKSGDRANPNQRTFSCAAKPDGTLGEWRDEAAMPQPTYGASSCGINDYIASVGGRYGNAHPTNSIWFSRMEAGKVREWTLMKSDLQSRVYHSLGLYKTNGWVFISGGKDKTTPDAGSGKVLDTIQVFRITQPEKQKLSVAEVAAAKQPDHDLQKLTSVDFNEALEKAREAKSELVVFYFSPEVPGCRRAWDTVIRTSEFNNLTRGKVFAAVDITKEGAASATNFSIFKVPSMVRLRSDGSVIGKVMSLRSHADAEELMKLP